MTKENILELAETNLTDIPEKFTIRYWANKHQKFILKNNTTYAYIYNGTC